MTRSSTILVFVISAMFLSTGIASAQRSTACYPNRIYPGDNIITLSDPEGIDRVTFTASSKTVVQVPDFRGCPKTLDIRIRLDDPTSNESVNLTVYDCSGAFTTLALISDNWNIVRRRTGQVMIGSDTCIPCEITSTDAKTVDSITTDNPDMRVEMPSKEDGVWRVHPGVPFNYNVCYRPRRVEKITENIKVYIHRQYANGGLTQYVILKPISATGIPAPEVKKIDSLPSLPPVTDPTTFRNIIMPTAKSVGTGKFFVADYDVVGALCGYGITDNLTVMGGGVFVPNFISRVIVGTLGVKYEAIHTGDFRAAAGGIYALSSTKSSDISTTSFFGILSYGNDERRVTFAGGYAWKHHKISTGEFDKNAVLLGFGGDYTIGRGWKLAAEGYYIESADLSPMVVTARYFTNNFAFDFGFGINLGGENSASISGLSGRLDKLSFAPVLSAVWVW